MTGLSSTAFDVTRTAALGLAVVFWLGLAVWVARDARRRSEDLWLMAAAGLLGLLPYLGPLAYLLVRSPETVAEARLRALEVRALEAQLPRAGAVCPGCGAAVEAGFLVCPICAERLRHPCRSCAAPVEPGWQACPYCATPLEPAAALPDELLAAVSEVAASELAATS